MLSSLSYIVSIGCVLSLCYAQEEYELPNVCIGNNEGISSMYHNGKELGEKSIETITEDEAYGPHLKVAVMTYCDDTPNGSCMYSTLMNTEYALRSGYAMKILNNSDVSKDLPNSVSQILLAMKTWAKDFDYLVYLNADAVFVDFTLRLEEVINKEEKIKAVFVVDNSVDGVSADFVGFRVSKWSLDFLDDWLEETVQGTISSDAALNSLYKTVADEYADVIKVIAAGEFRNEYPAIVNFKPSLKMLTLLGEPGPYKVTIFKQILDSFCENEVYSEFPEVNVSREALLRASIELQVPVWEAEIKEFASKSSSGDNDGKASEKLSILTSTLSMTIEVIKQQVEYEIEIPDGQHIRSKAFKQLFLNLKRRRKQYEDSDQTQADKDDWLKLLQAVARIGEEYVARDKTAKDHKTALKIVKEIVEELMELKPNDETTMQALINLNIDTGMIANEEGDYEEALSLFLAAVRTARKLGYTAGDQVVLEPTSHAAAAMAKLDRYEEAVVLYEVVTKLTSKYMGEDNLSLAYVSVQAAMAHNELGEYKKANQLLITALEIMSAEQQDVVDPGVYQMAINLYESTVNKRDKPKKSKK